MRREKGGRYGREEEGKVWCEGGELNNAHVCMYKTIANCYGILLA